MKLFTTTGAPVAVGPASHYEVSHDRHVGWPGENRPDRAEGTIRIRLATEQDRRQIFGLRHDVYAKELRQHEVNAGGRLRDSLDDFNTYLVAEVAGGIAGFISITPPGHGTYSLDKYVAREQLPFAFDDGLHEVRLLTVVPSVRGQRLAGLLMYAAFRWVEARGGTRIVAIGRREVLTLYLKAGLEKIGVTVQAGAVTYEVLEAPVAGLRERLSGLEALLVRIERGVDWRLPIAFRKPAACFHGGAFFAAIGDDFQSLERRGAIINADVLDAWFPPSPKVMAAFEEHLPWLLQTSPPTDCGGLVRAIAGARGVKPPNILPGAGSSDLIFLALREWLRPESRVLILDPTYGEYAHVLERVIGCHVQRFTLARQHGYRVDLGELEERLAEGYDFVVLVNPNSPTGRHVPRGELEALLRRVPAETRVWVDETYVDYVGAGESLEQFAAGSGNVVVCKSMSKVYALSGARLAYLCGPAHLLEQLRSITPPWAVSLPGQVAGVRALQDPDYYAARYAETHRLRAELQTRLESLGMEVIPGCANFLLCHLPESGPEAATVVTRCREHGLFVRDAGRTSAVLGERAIRIAVKDAAANRCMIEILRGVCRSATPL